MAFLVCYYLHFSFVTVVDCSVHVVHSTNVSVGRFLYDMSADIRSARWRTCLHFKSHSDCSGIET